MIEYLKEVKSNYIDNNYNIIMIITNIKSYYIKLSIIDNKINYNNNIINYCINNNISLDRYYIFNDIYNYYNKL